MVIQKQGNFVEKLELLDKAFDSDTAQLFDDVEQYIAKEKLAFEKGVWSQFGVNRNLAQEIIESQEEKSEIMDELKKDLTDLYEIYHGGKTQEELSELVVAENIPDQDLEPKRIGYHESTKSLKISEPKDGERVEYPVQALITGYEWGNNFQLMGSVPYHIAKKFLVFRARDKIIAEYDEQLIMKLAYSGGRYRLELSGIANAAERMVDEGVLEEDDDNLIEADFGIRAEQVMRDLILLFESIDQGKFKLLRSTFFHDMFLKVDAMFEHDDVVKGVQFITKSTKPGYKDRLATKRRQIAEANKKIKEINSDLQKQGLPDTWKIPSEIKLFEVDPEFVHSLMRKWEDGGRPFGGPVANARTKFLRDTYQEFVDVFEGQS
jgi:hypothetical protein